VVVAIFKIEDGTLTLATRGGGAEEAPRSFEATEDKGLTRYELRKVQPQKKNTQPPKANEPREGVKKGSVNSIEKGSVNSIALFRWLLPPP
jgi:hypothetical protein